MQTYKIIGADQKEYGPISIEQIRHWIKDNRLNAQTPAQRDGGEWQRLGDYAEFADLFQPAGAAAPSTAPAAFPSAPIAGTPASTPIGSRESALQAVKVPAIILIVNAAMGVAFYLFFAIVHLTGSQMLHQSIPSDYPPQLRSIIENSRGVSGGLGALLAVAMNAFVIVGALKMMRLESRGMAMAACIVALLPCNCCCLLGLPFGIWGLVAINKPEVKSHFTG